MLTIERHTSPAPLAICTDRAGFSLIEALIGAALISITALGLGSSINHLMQSREKSQMVSMSIQTESALVNAIQDPANYAGVMEALQHDGNPPSNFQLQVMVDPSSDKSFSIRPNQQIYLTDNLQACSSFEDKNCSMMVALSRWGKDVPIPGQYSFGYSIQTNPHTSNMPPLGSKDTSFASPSDFVLTVPSLANTGKLVSCGANAVGILGVDSLGQALCLYYSDNKSNCKADEIPKGFQVTADPANPHRYYLNFKCVTMRRIVCAKPDYSFENFNPVALDSTGTSGNSAVGKCVYIGQPTSNLITVNGTDGMTVSQLCAANYVAAAPSCAKGAVTGTNATCSDGHVLVANTSGVTAQMTNNGTNLVCQAVIPQQQCCADDPSRCTKVSVALKVNYTCALDSNHTDELVY
jgi:type II secretory pathway pseudopilin PulG